MLRETRSTHVKKRNLWYLNFITFGIYHNVYYIKVIEPSSPRNQPLFLSRNHVRSKGIHSSNKSNLSHDINHMSYVNPAPHMWIKEIQEALNASYFHSIYFSIITSRIIMILYGPSNLHNQQVFLSKYCNTKEWTHQT